MANKKATFHRPLNVDTELAENLIKVDCLLHNFVRKRDGYKFEDTFSAEGLNDMVSYPNQGGRFANVIRERFGQYFMSDVGKLEWQEERAQMLFSPLADRAHV